MCRQLCPQALLRRYERELKQLRQELAARSQNVVDKRKLLEVEEQRKQAEQDKVWPLWMAAGRLHGPFHPRSLLWLCRL